MSAEEEEAAASRAAEVAKDHATPQLPERLRFKGLKEALQLLFMKALNAEGIRERIESAMFFISTVSDMLMEEEDPDAVNDAKPLHDFVSTYAPPKFRRSVDKTRDGIPVRVIEEPGPEKSRHQFLLSDYRAVLDLLDESREAHFIRDVVPWFTAAREIARKHGYLRAEGEKLTSRKTLMTRQSLLRDSLGRKASEAEPEEASEPEFDPESREEGEE